MSKYQMTDLVSDLCQQQSNCSEEKIRTHLNSGGDLHITDERGNTLLHEAVLMRNKTLVHTLINAGAQLNLKNDLGDTPLLLALAGKLPLTSIRRDIVITLIQSGADITGQDNNGNTLLHIAASFADFPLAKALIEAGADIHTKNNKGETALDLSLETQADKEIIAEEYGDKKHLIPYVDQMVKLLKTAEVESNGRCQA